MGLKINKGGVIEKVWDQLLDVPYISPQPGIRNRFKVPKDARADIGRPLNNQPWYNGDEFRQIDKSADTIPQRFKK